MIQRTLFCLSIALVTASLCLAQPVTVTGPAVPGLMMGAVAWADYDSDGLDDLLICGMDSLGAARTVLLHSNGVALIPDLTQPLVALMQGDAAWGDMDNDGDPDLLLTGETSPGHGLTALYRNTGGVLTLVATPALPPLKHSRVCWADLDGDGDLDLLLAGHDVMQGLVGLIGRNDGGGVFTAVQGTAWDTREWPAVGAADLDGDGLVEMVFGDVSPLLSEGMRTTVLHNGGGLHFGVSGASVVPGLYGGSFDFADVDSDGDLDLLRSGMGVAAHVGVYANSGGVLASASVGSLPQAGFGEARFCDMDHDGDPDMVVAGMASAGPGSWVLRNAGGFFTIVQGAAAMPALYNVRIAFGDWNGDGFLDMAIAGQNADDEPEGYVATWNSGLQTFKF